MFASLENICTWNTPNRDKSQGLSTASLPREGFHSLIIILCVAEAGKLSSAAGLDRRRFVNLTQRIITGVSKILNKV